jgi:5-methylcytosine-specific restriction endonuclease McrA
VRVRVLGRAEGRCEASTPDCTGWALHAHHILRRSQGGRHTEENMLACCRPCHEYIHANPARSYEQGWLRRSGAMPGQTSFDDLEPG